MIMSADIKTVPVLMDGAAEFVRWFRAAAPYIHAFRGRTFVVACGEEVLHDGQIRALARDLNILAALGVRLVIAYDAQGGARLSVAARLRVSRPQPTDDRGLARVKKAVGTVRVEIEALLSMGPTRAAGGMVQVASGNFLGAKPMGVRGGVDFLHRGEVRRIDAAAIKKRLDHGDMVLLPPLGYAPNGEVFQLALEDVATQAAIALRADKLVFLIDSPGVNGSRGVLLRELNAPEAERVLEGRRKPAADVARYLPSAIQACRNGVSRAHLVSRHVDGALLLELFTHDGIGTMVTEEALERFRKADVRDVDVVLGLIEPLEREGVLVRRSRALLESEIERFFVLEHDASVVGCAALYPFSGARAAELACLVVHPDYRDAGRGAALLDFVIRAARRKGLRQLFVLTTRTAHWFLERGFVEARIQDLPGDRRSAYNYQRRSKIFVRRLNGERLQRA
ncbi:MAG: amino-acid N-acetyltransferase [Burkholderiales bacterium]